MTLIFGESGSDVGSPPKPSVSRRLSFSAHKALALFFPPVFFPFFFFFTFSFFYFHFNFYLNPGLRKTLKRLKKKIKQWSSVGFAERSKKEMRDWKKKKQHRWRAGEMRGCPMRGCPMGRWGAACSWCGLSCVWSFSSWGVGDVLEISYSFAWTVGESLYGVRGLL